VTRSVTASEAQLARVAWVLKGGADAAGVAVSQQTMQRLAMSIHKFMLEEGIYFDYQARVDREAAAMEQDVK
jgi:hypothetical protein